MTYKELFYKAIRLINKGEITLGEYEEMTKPLDREVEQEPRWIPVSERLPEKTGWYLITFKTYKGDYAVSELCYRKPENYWTDKNICKKLFDNKDVIAWMPLPSAYKRGEEV